MQERTGRRCGEFCLLLPFPHAPPPPLSNYNQIKDRVIVARHHWRVWRYYALHNIKDAKQLAICRFRLFEKEIFFPRPFLPTGEIHNRTKVSESTSHKRMYRCKTTEPVCFPDAGGYFP
jgi:hypothetical protein